MPNLSELLYYSGETSTQLIVWSLFIGVAIAAIAGYLIKAKFGAFIRKLLENEIDSPEKAVTLEELGFQKKFFIKSGLRSHANYKNMLVAITEDGRFFANNAYTSEEPAFKEFIVVKRKRATSLIKESESSGENVPLSGLAKVIQSKEKAASEKNSEAKLNETSATNTNVSTRSASPETETDTAIKETDVATQETADKEAESSYSEVRETRYSDIPKERVKFDVTKARYYIPPEIHDRAYSLYHTKTGKSGAFIPIILLLIALALVATFSGSLISGFTDFVGGIKNPFEKPII